MTKTTMVVGMLVALAGCAGTTAEDSTASLTSAVSTGSQSSGATENAGREQHHRGPPPEAFTACEGKAAGDACTVTHGSDSISGTCASPPPDAPDTRLACRPDHMPEGGPPGHDHAGGGGPRGDCQGGEKPADNGGDGPS